MLILAISISSLWLTAPSAPPVDPLEAFAAPGAVRGPVATSLLDAEALPVPMLEMFQPSTAIPFEDEKSAADFSYTYIEAGYLSTDIDQFDENTNQVYGRASLGLFNFLYVFADYTAASLDDVDIGGTNGDVSSDAYGLGVGAHFSLVPRLDLVGEAEWLYNDLSSDEFDDLDDTNNGWTTFAGARWMPLPWEGGGLELNGGFRWIDQEGLLSDDQTAAWEAGGRLHFLKFLSVGVGYTFLEEDSAYNVDARFSF